jgi:hypothetical protein
MPKRRRLDLKLVRECSIQLYLRILLRTIPEVWSGGENQSIYPSVIQNDYTKRSLTPNRVLGDDCTLSIDCPVHPNRPSPSAACANREGAASCFVRPAGELGRPTDHKDRTFVPRPHQSYGFRVRSCEQVRKR